LHALLIFLVNLPNQLVALLQPLLLLIHHAHLNRLVFLVAHHLLHALRLQLLGFLLNTNHLLVLSPLSFQALGLTVVLLSLGHLLVANGFFLVKTQLLVAQGKLPLLLFPLHLQLLLVVGGFGVSLAHLNDLGRFLLGLLDLLPGLFKSTK